MNNAPVQYRYALCLVIILILVLPIRALGQTYFANGNAKHVGGDCYQLTSQVNWQNGTVWYADKINLLQDFDLEFYMNFGNLDASGADGIVFVLQNKGNQAIGTGGGGLGYEGFSPSFGVEFDDFQNSNYGDPTYDHIAVVRDGIINHNATGALTQPVKATPDGANIEDGFDHLVRVKWTAESLLLQVYFDCDLRVEFNYDIRNKVFNGENFVYWGFTAATGGLNNKQTVCLRKDILARDTVPICKGDEVPLNSRQSIDNTYRWFPSTDLSDTTVKQPLCASIVPRTYYVEFKDLCDEKIIDTVNVVIHTPFTMDEVKDSLLCNGAGYMVDLTAKYDSVLWTDGYPVKRRWLTDAGYYKFRAWQGVCWDDDSLTINTDKSPKIEISGDSVFCNGDSVVLKQNTTPASAPPYWHTGLQDSVHVVTESERTYVVANNQCGSDSQTYYVREITLPEITISGNPYYCGQDSVTLTVQNNRAHVPRWDNGTNGVIRRTASGIFTARIQEHQCTQADTFIVELREMPIADVPDIPLMCLYEELLLTSNQPHTQRIWSIGDTATTADYTEFEGDHWLRVYNVCGADTAYFQINRKLCTCDMYIPTAFSPNKDDLNEQFRAIPDCDRLNSFELVVFNRWGQIIFKTNNVEESWDGRIGDNLLPNGIYFWSLSYSGIEGRSNANHRTAGYVHILH